MGIGGHGPRRVAVVVVLPLGAIRMFLLVNMIHLAAFMRFRLPDTAFFCYGRDSDPELQWFEFIAGWSPPIRDAPLVPMNHPTTPHNLPAAAAAA